MEDIIPQNHAICFGVLATADYMALKLFEAVAERMEEHMEDLIPQSLANIFHFCYSR